jgi:hypothetical protein
MLALLDAMVPIREDDFHEKAASLKLACKRLCTLEHVPALPKARGLKTDAQGIVIRFARGILKLPLVDDLEADDQRADADCVRGPTSSTDRKATLTVSLTGRESLRRESEERRRRREEIHDAMVEAEQAEAKAKEARRKHQAELTRQMAREAPPRPYTPRQEPPRSKKAAKRAARAAQRAGQATLLEHQVHSLPEQREIRVAAFDHKQAMEHANKVAREANEKLERLRRLDADASAAYEAAVHVVPPPATIADVLTDALRGVELSRAT